MLSGTYLELQRMWSEETFGPGPRTEAIIDHITKELKEVAATPWDLDEWADIIILALDGAWRAQVHEMSMKKVNGVVDYDEIFMRVRAKLDRNRQRTWPDWRTADPTKAIEHDRSHDA